jgi:transcriptional regulator with XRE-family HTH domain
MSCERTETTARRWRIRERRQRLGLSQKALAGLAGTNAAYVCHAERSGARTWYARAIRLALVRIERPRRQVRREQARVDRQRALFGALLAGPERSALQRSMEHRIRTLFDEHRMEEGDAILEFLPEADARRLLDEYFGW